MTKFNIANIPKNTQIFSILMRFYCSFLRINRLIDALNIKALYSGNKRVFCPKMWQMQMLQLPLILYAHGNKIDADKFDTKLS